MGLLSLESLAAHDFAEVLGQEFETSESEASPPLTLLRLRRLDELGEAPREGMRRPFSLTFEGPSDVPLEQRTYCLRNPLLGPIEVFIVPVAQGDSTRSYEAIFA